MNDTVTPIQQTTNTTHDYQTKELNLFYVICEIIVAFLAVVGNALVIYVFKKERRLRRRTNYYIISLATADFLVGLLGIPFAILSSVGFPNNLHACLFTVSLLVVLCTISIFCLVAVSVDRYWAILHPMGYSRNVRTKTALDLCDSYGPVCDLDQIFFECCKYSNNNLYPSLIKDYHTFGLFNILPTCSLPL